MVWQVSSFGDCPVSSPAALCDNCLQSLESKHWHEHGPNSGLKHGYGMYPEWPIGIWGFCSQNCATALLSALSAADIAARVYGTAVGTATAEKGR